MGPRAGMEAVKKRRISWPYREANPGGLARRYIDWAIPALPNSKSPLRIVGVQAEIRTGHLPNTSRRRYRLIQSARF
jgi:hypothetical protein